MLRTNSPALLPCPSPLLPRRTSWASSWSRSWCWWTSRRGCASATCASARCPSCGERLIPLCLAPASPWMPARPAPPRNALPAVSEPGAPSHGETVLEGGSQPNGVAVCCQLSHDAHCVPGLLCSCAEAAGCQGCVCRRCFGGAALQLSPVAAAAALCCPPAPAICSHPDAPLPPFSSADVPLYDVMKIFRFGRKRGCRRRCHSLAPCWEGRPRKLRANWRQLPHQPWPCHL